MENSLTIKIDVINWFNQGICPDCAFETIHLCVLLHMENYLNNIVFPGGPPSLELHTDLVQPHKPHGADDMGHGSTLCMQ